MCAVSVSVSVYTSYIEIIMFAQLSINNLSNMQPCVSMQTYIKAAVLFSFCLKNSNSLYSYYVDCRTYPFYACVHICRMYRHAYLHSRIHVILCMQPCVQSP